MCYEKISYEMAIAIAEQELSKRGGRYIKSTIHANYRSKKFRLGAQKKGWVVSVELDIDPLILDGRDLFIYISDPDGLIHIPQIL